MCLFLHGQVHQSFPNIGFNEVYLISRLFCIFLSEYKGGGGGKVLSVITSGPPSYSPTCKAMIWDTHFISRYIKI